MGASGRPFVKDPIVYPPGCTPGIIPNNTACQPKLENQKKANSICFNLFPSVRDVTEWEIR